MNREKKIERYMQDSQAKAESLYRAGYKEGWSDGYIAGRLETEEELANSVEKFADSIKPLKRTDLKVGDEVRDDNGYVAVVVNNDTALHLMYPHNGKTWKVPYEYIANNLTKTGRKFSLTLDERLPF